VHLDTRDLITVVSDEEKGFLGLNSYWFFCTSVRRKLQRIPKDVGSCELGFSLEPHMRKDDNEVRRDDK
jgi:hypothetical protein